MAGCRVRVCFVTLEGQVRLGWQPLLNLFARFYTLYLGQ